MSNINNYYLPSTFVQYEKYPFISDEIFIPLEYIHKNTSVPDNFYFINKKGDVKDKNGKILKHYITNGYPEVILKINGRRIHGRISRLVASTFLINLNPEIYSVVNHIDHNPKNNHLSNLEWVTQKENSNKKNGKSNLISEDKLVNYMALDDNGNELFSINKRNNPKNYSISVIPKYINENKKYKGYYWKRENKKEKIISGFSGNLDDYEWFEHWKYPGLYVCKEGFIKYKVRKTEKIIYSLINSGYVKIKIRKLNLESPAHRIIMEFILKRDLKDNEIVDHINTNRSDNSFSNLRITDYKGNMNNPNTIEKLSNKYVLSDLFGNFIMYGTSSEIYEFIYSINISELSKFNIRTSQFLSTNVIDKRFIFTRPNVEELLEKMKTIVYVFSEDMKLLNAFSNSVEASKEYGCNYTTILKHIKSGTPLKINKTIFRFIRGNEALDLIPVSNNSTINIIKTI